VHQRAPTTTHATHSLSTFAYITFGWPITTERAGYTQIPPPVSAYRTYRFVGLHTQQAALASFAAESGSKSAAVPATAVVVVASTALGSSCAAASATRGKARDMTVKSGTTVFWFNLKASVTFGGICQQFSAVSKCSPDVQLATRPPT
jgi:hypothetical protein